MEVKRLIAFNFIIRTSFGSFRGHSERASEKFRSVTFLANEKASIYRLYNKTRYEPRPRTNMNGNKLGKAKSKVIVNIYL